MKFRVVVIDNQGKESNYHDLRFNTVEDALDWMNRGKCHDEGFIGKHYIIVEIEYSLPPTAKPIWHLA